MPRDILIPLSSALALALSLACSPPEAAAPEANAAITAQASIELRVGEAVQRLQLDELLNQIEAEEFEVFNQEYGKTLSYRGLPLGEVLALAGIQLQEQEGDLIFHCIDGYAPSRSTETLAPLELMLAFEERGGWTPVPPREVDPGPFYVVSKRQEDYRHFPWPYQVVAIESVDPEQRFRSLLPAAVAAQPQAKRGYAAFREHCLSCHSINLVGGTIGPEFNVPMNLSEYRDEAFIRAFARSPSSFRARSPMPPFDHLPDETFDDLLAYLVAMRDHKVR